MKKIYVEVEDGWEEKAFLEIELNMDDFEKLSKEFFKVCGDDDLVPHFKDFLRKKKVAFKTLRLSGINLCIKMLWK